MRTIVLSLVLAACSTTEPQSVPATKSVELQKAEEKIAALEKELSTVTEANRTLVTEGSAVKHRAERLENSLRVIGETWLKSQPKRDTLIICLANETEGTGPLPDWLADSEGRCGPDEYYDYDSYDVFYTAAGEPRLMVY